MKIPDNDDSNIISSDVVNVFLNISLLSDHCFFWYFRYFGT